MSLDAIFLDALRPICWWGASAMTTRVCSTHRIQRKYGENVFAIVWLGIACAKRLVRPLLRGIEYVASAERA